MRIPLLVFQIYVLVLESQFSEGQRYPKDVVICSDSPSSVTLRCDDDEFLRIHNAAYAYMSRRYACTPSIVPDIEARPMKCKVGDLLPRCYGERVCTIEPREAAERLQNCCDTTGKCYSTTDTLHVRYSCEKVQKADSTLVVLPLSHGDVTGKSLTVLSPSYPNNIPSQLKTFSCSVAAASALSTDRQVLVKVTVVFVKFNPSKGACDEKLTFAVSKFRIADTFCSQHDITQWSTSKNYTASPQADNIFKLTYSKTFSSEGGKFVFDIEAFQSEESVDLKISCTNRENFTMPMTLPPPRETPSVMSPSLPSRSLDVSASTTAPRPQVVTTAPGGSQSGVDVGDPSRESEAESREESKDYMWIGIVVGVVVVVITAVIIVVYVVYRVRKRRQEKKNGRRMQLVATSPTPTPFPSPESVAIYSVARDVDEDVQNGNLTQQEIGDVSHMYAVVDKSRKSKAKSNNESDVVNDVMSADNGDVIMCENDELYDAMSPGEDKQNIKKDVNQTRDTDSVIMYENSDLYAQQ